MNIALVDQILEQIDGYPETWDQQVYASAELCGTSYCVAGWAVVLHGWTYGKGGDERWRDPSGAIRGAAHIRKEAQRLLDLNEDQGYSLFDGDNTRDEIEDILDIIRETS